MTQTDVSLSAELRPPRHRPHALRYMHMTLMTICGLLMAVIILSHPKVSGYFAALQGADTTAPPRAAAPSPEIVLEDEIAESLPELIVTQNEDQNSDSIGTLFGLMESTAEPSANKPPAPPTVSAMPQNRIPVRRGASKAGN
jgi:hypothetical protein